MRVTGVATAVIEVPFERPLVTGIHSLANLENITVEVTTDEGLVGTGYCFSFERRQAFAVQTLVEDLATLLVGKDPTQVRGHWETMWRHINFIGQAGAAVMAMAPLDMALWDLTAQAAGMPLYRLLGAGRSQVPLYVTFGYLASSTEEMVRDGLRYTEQGYRHLKIKIGSPDWRADVARVRSLREAVGPDIAIMVDANQAWDAGVSIRVGRALDEFNIAWLEEPVSVGDVAASTEVAAALDVPLASGETVFTRQGFLPLIERRAADVLTPDLMRCGGITEFLHIASLAQTFGLPVASHAFSFVSGHLIAACPNGILVEHHPGRWDALFQEAPAVENGQLRLADRPGLGITFNHDTIRRFRVA